MYLYRVCTYRCIHIYIHLYNRLLYIYVLVCEHSLGFEQFGVFRLLVVVFAQHGRVSQEDVAAPQNRGRAWGGRRRLRSQTLGGTVGSTPVGRPWLRRLPREVPLPQEGCHDCSFSHPCELWRYVKPYTLYIKNDLGLRIDDDDELPFCFAPLLWWCVDAGWHRMSVGLSSCLHFSRWFIWVSIPS